MTIHTFNHYPDVVSFIEDKVDDPTIALNISQQADMTYKVEVQPRKQYLDQSNNTCLDEVWITRDGEMLQVQDLSEAHVKNILRMILKTEREARMRYVEQLAEQLQAAFNDDDEDLSELREAISARLAEDSNKAPDKTEISPDSFFVEPTRTLQ
jgi:hypothetical protein